MLQGSMQYRGPVDVVRQVMRSEGGVRGLYKCMGPTLLREVPGSSSMFAAYEALKLSLAKQQVRAVLIVKHFLRCKVHLSRIWG